MLRVLQGAFAASFGAGKYSLGARVSLLVTVADIGWFNNGAAFWGLLACNFPAIACFGVG